MIKMKVTLNTAQNGIEIKFENKPEDCVLNELKANGFRWHRVKHIWYAKNTDERINFVNRLNSECLKTKTEKVKIETYDLWEMTRTEGIENNYVLYKIRDTKEIAAIIRKHIKPRFPMCKFSVTSDYNSICITLLTSPFAKDSAEVKAIVAYINAFAESYNYNNSDYESDYHDVNFYLSGNIVGYEYRQTEMTVSESNISVEFQKKAEQYAKEKAEKKEKEFQERMKIAEQQRIEAEKQRKIQKENHDLIESNIQAIKEVNYFVLGAVEGCTNKLNTLDGVKEEIEEKSRVINCKVTKEVFLEKQYFDLFKNMLLNDWSFIEGTGGSQCVDWRINSMVDYNNMTSKERETVEWYSDNCVAICCDGELQFIVDAQGYSYCRYVFTLSEDSKIVNEYAPEQVLSVEEKDEYKKLANILEDTSTEIIYENSYGNAWNTDKFNEYKEKMKSWIYNNDFKFNANVVRAIEINEDFKIAMYKLLFEINGIQEQFKQAKLEPGQKITLIFQSEFGGIVSIKVTFKSYMLTQYASHEAVELIMRPENKRNDYSKTLYKPVLVYNDWIDYPEELLWEELKSENGMICKKTRYTAFDDEQCNVIFNYFKEQGYNPIINTFDVIGY